MKRLVRKADVVRDDCNNCHICLEGKLTEYGFPVLATRMILCPTCGNKRCPKASDHLLECTNSNEPEQPGSVYRTPLPKIDDLI